MSEPIKKLDWKEVRQHAQTHPAMYIGEQEHAHKGTIQAVFQLVWQGATGERWPLVGELLRRRAYQQAVIAHKVIASRPAVSGEP